MFYVYKKTQGSEGVEVESGCCSVLVLEMITGTEGGVRRKRDNHSLTVHYFLCMKHWIRNDRDFGDF